MSKIRRCCYFHEILKFLIQSQNYLREQYTPRIDACQHLRIKAANFDTHFALRNHQPAKSSRITLQHIYVPERFHDESLGKCLQDYPAAIRLWVSMKYNLVVSNFDYNEHIPSHRYFLGDFYH